MVLDEDVGLDEKLGYADVEWMECFENPTQWMINKVIPLQGEMDMGVDNGRIYT